MEEEIFGSLLFGASLKNMLLTIRDESQLKTFSCFDKFPSLVSQATKRFFKLTKSWASYSQVRSLVCLIAHQSIIRNFSCWRSPCCIKIFPVLDKEQLEVISSWVHLAACCIKSIEFFKCTTYFYLFFKVDIVILCNSCLAPIIGS